MSMKILYAIQGTGNGHISRSFEIIPYLEQWGTVDILISGTQWQVPITHPIAFKKHGLGYISSKNGGLNFIASLKELKPLKLINDIRTLPIHEYDIIISDCEPISAWACYLNNKQCIALSNQASFFSPHMPRPKQRNILMETLIKQYAYCPQKIGYHYEAYDSFITTPIIKKSIRTATITDQGHITVYLPSYSPKDLINYLSPIKETRWEIFSSHITAPYCFKNITLHPIGEQYLKSVLSCHGIICAAGFQATAEALYLGKKMLVIPQHHQYEQWCNAVALQALGITVIEKIQKDFTEKVRTWLYTAPIICKQYPDNAQEIAEKIIKKFGGGDGS